MDKASRFIVTFLQELNSGSSFESERRIIAESASEAAEIFKNEHGGGKYFSNYIRHIVKDYNPLTPDEEKEYNNKKKIEQEKWALLQKEREKEQEKAEELARQKYEIDKITVEACKKNIHELEAKLSSLGGSEGLGWTGYNLLCCRVSLKAGSAYESLQGPRLELYQQYEANLKAAITGKKQQLQWEKQGLCKYCGRKLSGLFTKKCKNCKEKN